MSITSKAVADLAQALAEILITANTALEDEGVTDWAEGGWLGDALIAIRDAAETAIKTVGTTAAPADLLAELELIVAGWEAIERGEVRGRRLTAWEEERLSFARKAIGQARGPIVNPQS